jgi:hypothetical protein
MYISYLGPLCLFPTEVRSVELDLGYHYYLLSQYWQNCELLFDLLGAPCKPGVSKSRRNTFQTGTRKHWHVTEWLHNGVWIGSSICWTLTDPWLQVIKTVSLIHTLYSSLEQTLKSSQPAVSSPVFWQRLTLGFRTVPVPQLQQLSTD